MERVLHGIYCAILICVISTKSNFFSMKLARTSFT